MRVEPCPPSPAVTPSRSPLVAAGAARASEVTISVTTRDGDTIAISAAQATAIAIAATGDDDRSGAALVRSGSSSVEISVAGSLDHDEIVDLEKVLKVLAHAAHRRDAQRLLQRLTRPDLDSLTRIEASSQSSTAVVVAGVTP